jgi:N-methylhydantoinase A
MERALRVISVERGHDPRDLVLLSFGGAGGLHACALAQSLGIQNVLIPPMASTLSAFGMLVADVIKDFSQTIMVLSNKSLEQIDHSMKSLEEQGRNAIVNLGFPQNKIIIERNMDMRYHGQSYELSVPYGQDFFNSFHQLHSKYYGYAKPDSLIEIVNLRVRAIGKNSPPPLKVHEFVGEDPGHAFLETTDVYFDEHKTITPLYKGELLQTGNIISGPAIIVRTDTTILLPPNAKAHVDIYENLFVKVGR